MATVSNLGSKHIEDRLRDRIESVLKDHPGVLASVTGDQGNENWDVTVENSNTGKKSVTTITGPDGQTVEDAVDSVKAGIAEVE